SLFTVLRRPRFLWTALGGSWGGAAIFAFISGSPGLLMGSYGFGEAEYGWTFAAFSLVLAAASQANFPLLRRFSQAAIMRGALAVMCAASLAVTLCCGILGLPGAAAMLALILACLAPVPLVAANSAALAMNECGRHAGSASSMLGVMQFAAAGAVSSGLGPAARLVDMPLAFMIFLASAAALGCLAIGARAGGRGSAGGSGSARPASGGDGAGQG
ncbi:MAG: hypothetical protein LBW85_12030, partial [Deltaproteobacteria bacterium]|nr:hypothetical protein [Deltaproteobacteria bacterium]